MSKSETKTKLAFAICQFLKAEMAANPHTEESLEVAVQCLESAYDFECDDVEAEAKYDVSPLTLEGIFEKAVPSEGPIVEEFEEVSAAQKAKAESLKDEGNQCLKDFAYEKAVQKYTEAIQIDPNNAVYYCNRAAAHMKLNDLDAAAADCLLGIEKNPEYSKAYGRLGACYYQQQKYSKSIEAYQKGLEVAPGNKVYLDGLKQAENKASDQASRAAVNTRSSNPQPPAGMPGMPGMPGGGGMPDLAGLMNNPALMQMAQQVMANGGMDELLQNPAMRDMAAKFAEGAMRPPQ
ncbi:hypothetical protein SARC_01888 [Sphaeroforma arctica JP610]|uniref:SGTA homodimerisation domain-containing protein n=1 Tax=Sphaeroforma arctica JP610 TaxID=667725 RepID=A0A0L0GAL8_9EUKA|nr:hypothetical protein SARC_01888 [Sphaeroforma arctica JP610]KNC85941.1 hypothetical protein SARC_01888 [Sphaeroforma arctica JP610]|eukprot:XP_014159843.1 hypothetical protein SARC_01888 [Sphaeroforma arctica JP610]